MTMNNCIKCGILTNEIKILINCIYKLKSKYNKNCVECCEWASKGKDELAEIIKNESLEEHRKDYISAAIHKKDYHFEKCKIESHGNIPINEIGPMNGELLCKNDSKDKIDLRKACVGNFYWLHELLKTEEQYSKIYKEKIDGEQCFNENKNMMFEFPIILVTPPCRAIKRRLDVMLVVSSPGVTNTVDVKLKYYVEDGNHRLLKWIDSGNKTVPAFVIIDPEYAP